MSFEYIVDLTLHLGNFRNFELLFTGAYRIRAQTYTLDDSKKLKTFGLPYLLHSDPDNLADFQFFQLSEGYLDVQDNSFSSSSFYVDYSDVYKELNQICVFRYVFESDIPQEIFFDFELQMLTLGQVAAAHRGRGRLRHEVLREGGGGQDQAAQSPLRHARLRPDHLRELPLQLHRVSDPLDAQQYRPLTRLQSPPAARAPGLQGAPGADL
jgi:hypothetical protein